MVKKYLKTGVVLVGAGAIAGAVPNISGTTTEAGLKTNNLSNVIDMFDVIDIKTNNLSNVIDMFDVIDNIGKKGLSESEIKKEVSGQWIQTKKDKNLKTEKEIDRILVDSATKILKEGGKK